MRKIALGLALASTALATPALAKDKTSILEVAQALGYKDEDYDTNVALALRDKINGVLSQIEAF